MNQKFIFFISILFVFSFSDPSIGQNLVHKNYSWLIQCETAKAFIENKGQFNERNETLGSKILFAIDQGPTQIYFTKNGLTYQFFKKAILKKGNENIIEEVSKRKSMTEKEWMAYEEEERKIKIETEVVIMEWENANPDAEIIPGEKSDGHFSYSFPEENKINNINHVNGYKSITYKSLYPGIDAEYIFHPSGSGIKYSLILHPGADISQVKMKFSDTEKLTLNEHGEIRITTKFGDVTDHAPATFYRNNYSEKIKSSFYLNGTTVSFKLEEYDKTRTIVIDPWTVTPTFSGSNSVWDVETDAAGNIYAYGGASPLELRKYSSSGAFIWAYTTSFSIAGGDWIGALATDTSGNSYITMGSPSLINKIDSSGSMVWANSGGNREYWDLAFNCDYTRLMVGGMYMNFPLNPVVPGGGGAVEVDVNTGNIIDSIKVSAALSGSPPFPNEIRSLCSSPNGNYYYLLLDSLGSFSPSMTLNYNASSSYTIEYYSPMFSSGNKGIHAIKASRKFVYTFNGSALHKRNIANGAIISTVTVPNGFFSNNNPGNSGIDIDSCGNVYVGSGNQLIKYDTDLNFIDSAATPSAVYDVVVNNNGEVVACGNGFIASYNMSNCARPVAICIICPTLTMSSANATCGNPNGTATVTPAGGSSPYTYQWSNGQTTATATGLIADTMYVVTVSDNSGLCSDTISVIVNTTSTPVATIQGTTGICAGSQATLNASGGTTYQWSTGDTTPSITVFPDSATAYLVTVTNACGSDTAQITVNVTGSILTANTDSTPAFCMQCNGTATITAAGGNGNYIYSWSNGQSAATATGLCAGSYTVTVTEAGTAMTVFWSEDFSSGGTGWTLNTNGTGANGTAANFWIINSLGDCDCDTGNYLHITCNQASFACQGSSGGTAGCFYHQGPAFFDDPTTDKIAVSPDISTVGKTNINLKFKWIASGEAGDDFGKLRLSSDGGTTWTELSASYSGALICGKDSITLPAIYENIPNFKIAFRWQNSANGNGDDPPFGIDDIELSYPAGGAVCPYMANITIDSSNVVVANAQIVSDDSVVCTGDTANLMALGGITYQWSTGQTGSNISVNNITSDTAIAVIVTDSLGCNGTDTFEITTSALSVNISGPDTLCSGQSAALTASGGDTYLWSSGETNSIITVAPATDTSYSVAGTNTYGCSDSDTITIYIIPGLDASVSNDTAIQYGTSLQLNASGGTSYLWSTGETSQNITVTPLETTAYMVTITDASGCSDTAIINITIDDSRHAISVPSVFSPNGDGINDVIKVHGYGVKEYKLVIYDRWGETVFEDSGTNLSNGGIPWDGSLKGTPLNSAVFAYTLDAVFIDNSEFHEKGNITLLR